MSYQFVRASKLPSAVPRQIKTARVAKSVSPHGRSRWCAVAALEQWRVASGLTEGAMFRPIDRHHRVGPKRLSGEAVCLVVRERVQAAGIDPKGYSGHSLRAGLA